MPVILKVILLMKILYRESIQDVKENLREWLLTLIQIHQLHRQLLLFQHRLEKRKGFSETIVRTDMGRFGKKYLIYIPVNFFLLLY